MNIRLLSTIKSRFTENCLFEYKIWKNVNENKYKINVKRYLFRYFLCAYSNVKPQVIDVQLRFRIYWKNQKKMQEIQHFANAKSHTFSFDDKIVTRKELIIFD